MGEALSAVWDGGTPTPYRPSGTPQKAKMTPKSTDLGRIIPLLGTPPGGYGGVLGPPHTPHMAIWGGPQGGPGGVPEGQKTPKNAKKRPKIVPFNNSPIRDKIGHFLPIFGHFLATFWPLFGHFLATFGHFLATFWPLLAKKWPLLATFCVTSYMDKT